MSGKKIVKQKIIPGELKNDISVFSCGCLFGALFFIYFFGTAILNFTYTGWLMSYNDITQHYLGWRFLRNSPWSFPLGLLENIVYPFRISVIYTDSIPLFAIFFKLLSPLLPYNFQYFGLYGIICYMLQGGVGALLIRKIGGNTVQSIIGSLFFIISPVMMLRMYHHTALASHFIILLCMLLYLQENYCLKKQILLWGGLLALSASIHLNITPMVIIFLFFRQLQEGVLSKKIKNPCIVFVTSMSALFVLMYCLGAFYFVRDTSAWGLGICSANLNAFFNSQGTSAFLPSLPMATEWQYEGYAYLGLGIIINIVLIIVISVIKLLQKRSQSAATDNDMKKIFPFLLGIVLSFLVFALSPVITLNQYTLITISLSKFIEGIWSIFRSTGRMTWPVVYIIFTGCIWRIITGISPKKSVVFLCVLVLIQFFDFRPWFTDRSAGFKTKTEWQTDLSSPEWSRLAGEYKHIFLFDDPYTLEDERPVMNYTYCFLDMAANNGMTVNDAWLARKNLEMIKENKQKEFADLLNGKAKNNTIYVFYLVYNDFKNVKDAGMYFYLIDNVIICLNSEKSYLEEYAFIP